MRRLALLLTMVLSVAAFAQSEVRNGGFEAGHAGEPPREWSSPPEASGFRATIVEGGTEGDKALLFERSGHSGTASWNTVTQSIDATEFRGKRIEYSAQVRFFGVTPDARTQMWLRVDLADGTMGFFDNMADRPIRDTEWTRHTIVGDIDENAERIVYGLMISGGTQAWMDDVQIRVIGDAGAGDRPPAALSDRAVENLEALARLYGYVRFFHPSDQAFEADWTTWLIDATERVEAVANDGDLALVLTGLIEPVAPTVRVWAGGEGDPPPPADLGADDASAYVAWTHNGLGSNLSGGRAQPIYRSERVEHDLGDGRTTEPGVRARETVTRELCPGVWARVPIAVYSSDDGTLPMVDDPEPVGLDRPEGWRPSVIDRTTRLAIVMQAWATLHHFYPYFDVVEGDWDDVLAPALRSGAADKDAQAFALTMNRLGGALHDGHTRVMSPGRLSHTLPFVCEWIEDRLVVVGKLGLEPKDVEIGDIVVAIDGRRVEDLHNEHTPLISASNEGWLRYRSAQEVTTGPPGVVTITTRKPSGDNFAIDVERVPVGEVMSWEHDRPANGAEVAPGIVYFNLHGASTKELERHMDAFVNADGIVFDLRGYPGGAGADLMPYLSDDVLHSAWWNIPVYTHPDQEHVEWKRSRWTLKPKQPRLTGNIVFITDGRAISYAESCMGIVEHYELGEIVGAPTAGTNGNVNTVVLPGGVAISFTGMKVTKHDDSQHHAIGILPTVPCEPTIEGVRAGRDELLEKAVEVAKAEQQSSKQQSSK